MVKIVLFVALCLASTAFAAPKGLGDWQECASVAAGQLVAAVEKASENALDCTAGAAEEILALEEELVASVSKASAAIDNQVDALKACTTDACRTAAIQEIVGIALTNAQENAAIIEKHINNLEGKFPEAAECIAAQAQELNAQLRAIVAEAIACIKA